MERWKIFGLLLSVFCYFSFTNAKAQEAPISLPAVDKFSWENQIKPPQVIWEQSLLNYGRSIPEEGKATLLTRQFFSEGCLKFGAVMPASSCGIKFLSPTAQTYQDSIFVTLNKTQAEQELFSLLSLTAKDSYKYEYSQVLVFRGDQLLWRSQIVKGTLCKLRECSTPTATTAPLIQGAADFVAKNSSLGHLVTVLFHTHPHVEFVIRYKDKPNIDVTNALSDSDLILGDTIASQFPGGHTFAISAVYPVGYNYFLALKTGLPMRFKSVGPLTSASSPKAKPTGPLAARR